MRKLTNPDKYITNLVEKGLTYLVNNVRHVHPGDRGGAAGLGGTKHGENPGPASKVQDTLSSHRARRMLNVKQTRLCQTHG